MINELKKDFTVVSELESVKDIDSYDLSEQSALKDFIDIKETDFLCCCIHLECRQVLLLNYAMRMH